MSDEELTRLDAILASINPDDSMLLEEVDGFFAALICCPDRVPPGEYLPVLLGDDSERVRSLETVAEAEDLMGLLTRHWNSVAGQLYEGEGFTPVLTYDESGQARGNAWAIGFVRGMSLRPEAWEAVDEDDELAESLDPLMRLVEEVGPPEGPAGDVIPEVERESVIAAMLEGVLDVYDYFRDQREAALRPAPIRTGPRPGRNDPCSCGSGRKYKNCCGAN